MREIIYQRLGTDIRSWLVQQCVERAKSKQQVLYLAPSREVIFSVRGQIESVFGGVMNIQVGGFEDLERQLLRDHDQGKRLIDQDTAVKIIQQICLKSCQDEAFSHFAKASHQDGLGRLLYRQLKRVKRENLTPSALNRLLAAESCDDAPLIWKLLNKVYGEYQDILADQKLMDVDDRSMLAAAWVPGPSVPLPDFMILDGFINVDPVHRDMLAAVLDHIPQLDCLVGIPFHTEATAGFIEEEIGSDLRALGFRRNDPPSPLPVQPMAAEQLALQLFDLTPPQEMVPQRVEIVDAPCLEDEVRQVLRQVRKRLMVENVKPEQIALVLKDQSPYQERLVRIAAEFSIPLQITPARPLHNSHLVKDVLRTLEAVTLLQASRGGNHTDSILFSANGPGDDPREWFASFWPQTGMPTEYCDQLLNWLKRYKLTEHLANLCRQGAVSEEWMFRELTALQVFINLLSSLSFSYSLLEESSPVTAADFLQILLREVEEHSVQDARPLGGVKVLDPDLLRGTSFEHVFFMGLNDGLFPRTGEQDLFSLSVKEGSGAGALPVLKASWELEREKIRFILVCAAARSKLVLSYRTAKEDGSFLLPSPFLQDAAELLGVQLKPTRSMRDRYDLPSSEIMSLPELFRWWAGNLSRQTGEAEGMSWAQGWLESGLLDRMGRIQTAVGIENRRFSPFPPDCYDGNLTGSSLVQKEKSYPFSASQLNDYRRCPFRYFVSRVLGLRAEEEEEISPLFLGSLYHSVLAEYYRSEPGDAPFNEKALADCLEEGMASLADFRYNALFLRAKGAEISTNLAEFIEDDIEYRRSFQAHTGTRLVPTYLEWQLDDEDTLAGYRFKASIDRVDLEMMGDAPTGRFVVYDYKTKAVKSMRDILKGDDLQIPLYGLLTESALRSELGLENVECMGVLGYSITKKEKKGLYRDDWRKPLGIRSRGIHARQWPVLMEGFQQRIIRMVTKIHSGDFALPHHCVHQGSFIPYECVYEDLCRFHPLRMAAKGGHTLE